MNYILRYTGKEGPDPDKVTDVLSANQVSILDRSSLPKMLLVGNISGNLLDRLQHQLPGWNFIAQREQAYQVPDTRRKVKK
jgi:hypothetical protein